MCLIHGLLTVIFALLVEVPIVYVFEVFPIVLFDLSAPLKAAITVRSKGACVSVFSLL